MNKDDIIKELEEKIEEFRAEFDDGLINYNHFVSKVIHQYEEASKRIRKEGGEEWVTVSAILVFID